MVSSEMLTFVSIPSLSFHRSVSEHLTNSQDNGMGRVNFLIVLALYLRQKAHLEGGGTVSFGS